MKYLIPLLFLCSPLVAQEKLPLPLPLQSPYYVYESQGWVPTGRLGIIYPRYYWGRSQYIVYDPDRATAAELRQLRGQMWAYPLHGW